jgi:subtilase family serine protease
MAQNIRKDTDPRVPDCGWSGEAALDIQWAHAIAPQAKLVLVEAISSRKDDMFAAVDKANEIAENSGGGVVSLSWSYDEFGGTHIAGEAAYDQHFQHDSILYFVSSGDQGGWVEYPSASPFVVSVGGTELLRDANNSVLIEQGWSSSGGGSSNFELLPPFQANVENTAGTRRVTPDIAGPAGLDATGANGSPSYAGTTCEPYQPGWYLVGGTSLATPIVAAAANLSYPKGGKTITILQNIYKQRTNKLAVRDITAGQAGTNIAMPGYDKVTGVGVPASTQFVK